MDDPRFTSQDARAANSAELVALIADRFARQARAELGRLLDGQRCIWAPVQTVDEITDDPQVRANGYLAQLRGAATGQPFEVVAIPAKLGRTPGAARAPAPALGEQTESSLLGLGYSWDDIGGLKDAGAII